MSGEKSPVYIESDAVNTGSVAINLKNNSEYWGTQDGSPMLIEIIGPLPHDAGWRIIKDGELVAEALFTVTLSDNQRLLVSSYPEDMYARVYNEDNSFSDVSQQGDFSKANYIRVPTGNSILLVSSDAASQVNVAFREERLLV